MSYTAFEYSDAKLAAAKLPPGGTVKLSFMLANRGGRGGDEVAQVYFRHSSPLFPQARLALCGFARVHLEPRRASTVAIAIPAARFRFWDTSIESYVVEPGAYELLIGGGL